MSTAARTHTPPPKAKSSQSETGVHPSAVGSATQPDTKTPGDQQENGDKPKEDSEYPEQKHAGMVGYGPEYNKGAGFDEKLAGVKEMIKGKLTGKSELVERGHERKTGELKHKEMEKDDKNPFEVQDDKKGQGDAGSENSSGDVASKKEPAEAKSKEASTNAHKKA